MKKITAQSITAFFSGRNLSAGNMSIEHHESAAGPVASMYLHGNLIAKRIGLCNDYDLALSDGGWESNTTKERLNGLLNYIGAGVCVTQKDYVWYIGALRAVVDEDWLGSVVVRVRGGVVTAIESTRDNGAVINVPLAA